MNLRWTPEAAGDLEHISQRIAEDNPEAVENGRIIFERIEQFVTFRRRGRTGREEVSRELVLSPLPYIVVYRVKTPLWKSCIFITERRTGKYVAPA